MQTMLQLNPPIPLNTPKGEGIAVLVIDYGPDHDLWWTVILTKGGFAGEIWTYPNPQVRGVENLTLGRNPATPPGAKAPDLTDEMDAQDLPLSRRGVERAPTKGLAAPLSRLPGHGR